MRKSAKHGEACGKTEAYGRLFPLNCEVSMKLSILYDRVPFILVLGLIAVTTKVTNSGFISIQRPMTAPHVPSNTPTPLLEDIGGGGGGGGGGIELAAMFWPRGTVL